MASQTPRHRLSRFFRRRDTNTTASEPAHESAREPAREPALDQAFEPPVTSPAKGHVRRRSSRRSMRDFVQKTSHSLSRSRGPSNRNSTTDTPPLPIPYLDSVTAQRSAEPYVAGDRPRNTPSYFNEAAPSPSVPTGLRSSRRFSRDAVADRHGEPHGRILQIQTDLNARRDRYSESVADWNMALNGQHYNQEPVSPVSAISSRRLSHKPDLPDLRRVSGGQEKEEVGRISLDNVPPRGSSWRHSADFHKPLPHLPKETATNDSTEHDSGHAIPRKPIVETSDTPIDPSKYVDLSNTKQTHVNVNWSPAVTHEVRQVDTHEIVQEAITREIHNHHIYHRVLPVIDVEILPARHFVPTADGGYREISEAEIPHGSNPDRLQQIIQEAVNNSMPKCDGPSGRRAFTARKFEGTEGDYREHTTPDGAKHTEQWWVHPPTLETGGQESGQTAPFYFDSEDPEDDGFRGFQHKTPPGLRSLREAQAARRTEAFSSDVTGRFATPPTHTILPFRMAHGTPAS